ncbi:hypothetical protein ACTNE0_12075, partial [Bacillota bacterium HCP3S3_E9]
FAVISLYMKCWNGDHDELRRGDFIYRGAAGRGMGVLEKMLKKYSMLEISGTKGYQMLKKTSKQKF